MTRSASAFRRRSTRCWSWSRSRPGSRNRPVPDRRASQSPRGSRDRERGRAGGSDQSRPRRHGRGHSRPRGPGDTPLRASGAQPDPAADRSPVPGCPGAARGRAPDRPARGAGQAQRRAARDRPGGDGRIAMTVAGAREALERARPVMLPEAAGRAADVPSEAGYLDLLPSDVPSTGPTQDLMRSRLVPQIYERWWRPALGRVAKGITGPGMAEEVRIARLMMALSHGDAVLDLACGPGNFSREFARAVTEAGLVVGVDASRTMLERAADDIERSEIRNLALIRGGGEDLPFRDDCFDAVCCFAALHLFAEPFTALGELARVLAPGGRIAIMTSVRRQVALPALKPLVERASGMRLFEPDEIVAALQMRGFHEIHQ